MLFRSPGATARVRRVVAKHQERVGWVVRRQSEASGRRSRRGAGACRFAKLEPMGDRVDMTTVFGLKMRASISLAMNVSAEGPPPPHTPCRFSLGKRNKVAHHSYPNQSHVLRSSCRANCPAPWGSARQARSLITIYG